MLVEQHVGRLEVEVEHLRGERGGGEAASEGTAEQPLSVRLDAKKARLRGVTN